MSTATFRIWRGEKGQGDFKEYKTEVSEGMVVLDAVHNVQATQANDLAVRWNCKAGKCGSCSAEINGKPALMCMTQMAHVPLDQPIVLEPMRSFPLLKDLVTDVSWNYRVKQRIQPFKPRPPDAADGTGLCNITKCCTKVCPENITITDNAIIPLKERVVDEHFDPLIRVLRWLGVGRK